MTSVLIIAASMILAPIVVLLFFAACWFGAWLGDKWPV